MAPYGGEKSSLNIEVIRDAKEVEALDVASSLTSLASQSFSKNN